MLAVLGALMLGIAAFRDFFTTNPTHQQGLFYLGLALVALHFAWDIAVPNGNRKSS